MSELCVIGVSAYGERRTMVNLAVLFTFIAAALGAVQVVNTTRKRVVFLTTSSPNGTYVVRLAGQKDRPKVPVVSHAVIFSVTKDGEPLLTDNLLHSADWLDSSFDLLYPQHYWVKENVLQFYRGEFFSEGTRESIVIQNKTDKVIEYLRVTSVDSFLLFDLQPHATLTLPISAARADNRWVSIEGGFPERKKIKQTGAGFLFPKDRQGPFVYYIYINENDLVIESPGLEKYKGS